MDQHGKYRSHDGLAIVEHYPEHLVDTHPIKVKRCVLFSSFDCIMAHCRSLDLAVLEFFACGSTKVVLIYSNAL